MLKELRVFILNAVISHSVTNNSFIQSNSNHFSMHPAKNVITMKENQVYSLENLLDA